MEKPFLAEIEYKVHFIYKNRKYITKDGFNFLVHTTREWEIDDEILKVLREAYQEKIENKED